MPRLWGSKPEIKTLGVAHVDKEESDLPEVSGSKSSEVETDQTYWNIIDPNVEIYFSSEKFEGWKTGLRDKTIKELKAEKNARKDNAFSKVFSPLIHAAGPFFTATLATVYMHLSQAGIELAYGSVGVIAGALVIYGCVNFDIARHDQKPYIQELETAIAEKKETLQKPHRK